MNRSAPSAIDIIVNLHTPQEVQGGQTGLDESFHEQVRMSDDVRHGVTVEEYLRRMDRAGIERGLLLATRAGDLRVRGSYEIPYERVARSAPPIPIASPASPASTPPAACSSSAISSVRLRNWASSARISIRTGWASRQMPHSITRPMPSAANSTSRS